MTSLTHRNIPSNLVYLDACASSPRSTDSSSSINGEDSESERIRGILTCIGGILIFLSLGSIYTFGNMLPYFASYLSVVNSDDDYSGYLSKCNYIFALTICGQSIFFPIGGQMGTKFGAKITIIIGCIIQSVFAVLSTYFVCDNYILIYFTYGILFGVGIGISYPNILGIVMQWYPERKGFVNGVVLCGFGISASIFDKVQTVLINPDNYEQNAQTGFANQEIIQNFPLIFVYLGASFLVMQIIGVLLMSPPPNHNNTIPTILAVNENDETMPLIAIAVDDTEIITAVEEGFDVTQVLKDIRFWHLYVNFFVDGMIIVVVSTQWKIFSNRLGIDDDAYLSLIGSISAIFNGGGRIVFGAILDHTNSFRFTLGSVNLVLCLLLYLWPFCIGNIMPFIWVCLLFALFASNFSIFPTILSQTFGAKNVATNIGLIFTSQIFSAFIGIYALEKLDAVLNNWTYIVFMVASIQLLGALLSFAFTNDSNHNKDNTNATQRAYCSLKIN